MKAIKQAGIIFLRIIIVVIVTGIMSEIAARFFLEELPSLGERAIHPYFMNGTAQGRTGNYSRAYLHQGPEVYGYENGWGMYYFNFENPVHTMVERGDFVWRDHLDIYNDPDSDVYRIFIIGGSVADGAGVWGAEESQRWQLLLEEQLQAATNRDTALIRASVGGFVSTQERIMMDLMVLPLEPDAIIFVDGWNDVGLPVRRMSRPGDPSNMGIHYRNYYDFWYGPTLWLANHSRLFRYLFYSGLNNSIVTRQDEIANDSIQYQNYVEGTTGIYRENIEFMLERCERYTIPCLGFLQPSRDLSYRDLELETEFSSEAQLIIGAYEALLTNLPAGVIDLTEVFHDMPELPYYDPVHFDAPGHAAFANGLFPYIRDMINEDE